MTQGFSIDPNNIKEELGEMHWTIIVLQSQLKQAQDRIAELEKQQEDTQEEAGL